MVEHNVSSQKGSIEVLSRIQRDLIDDVKKKTIFIMEKGENKM